MLTSTAPTTGANFQRLDLAITRQGLETLAEEAKLCRGLTDDQRYWFQRYLNAWDFYRPSQPEQYQENIELLISEIFGCTVFS